MKDFKKLMIWQKAMTIVEEAYEVAAKFPVDERYGLRSQVSRCAVSIAANIAEGSSRESDKDYRRFIEIALGSCFELETHCLVALRLNMVTENSVSRLLAQIEEEERMLTAFMKALKTAKG